VAHEIQDTPEFQFHSPYRQSPDVEFEEKVDLALRDIERKLRLEQGSRAGEYGGWPKKIWQVWLSKGWRPGDPDSEGFGPIKETQDGKGDQKIQYMKAWKEVNPDYEHTVRPCTAPASKYSCYRFSPMRAALDRFKGR